MTDEKEGRFVILNKYRSIFLVFILVFVLLCSFPLSSSAYSGTFNGNNTGIVVFLTSDGEFLAAENFPIATNGTFYTPNFTGYSRFKIPSYVEASGRRYQAKSLEFYNNYLGNYMPVISERDNQSSNSWLDTTVTPFEDYFDVYINASNYNVEGYNFWSQWYISNICWSKYGSQIGSISGAGSPDFNPDNNFMIIAKLEVTLQDVLAAITGITDGLDELEQAVKDGNLTLSEILKSQQDLSDKQDETNKQLQDLNDAMKPDGTDKAGNDASSFVNGATDFLNNHSTLANESVDSINKIAKFVSPVINQGFSHFAIAVYNSASFTIEKSNGQSLTYNLFNIGGSLIIVAAVFYVLWRIVPR